MQCHRYCPPSPPPVRLVRTLTTPRNVRNPRLSRQRDTHRNAPNLKRNPVPRCAFEAGHDGAYLSTSLAYNIVSLPSVFPCALTLPARQGKARQGRARRGEARRARTSQRAESAARKVTRRVSAVCSPDIVSLRAELCATRTNHDRGTPAVVQCWLVSADGVSVRRRSVVC